MVVLSPEESVSKAGEIIVYETNSNLVPNIITGTFYMEFIYDSDYTREYPCYLKFSRKQNNLLLLCTISISGEFLLLKQTHVLNDIHYKYNFIIKKKKKAQLP